MKTWTGSDTVVAVVSGNFAADKILVPLAKAEPLLHAALTVAQILVAVASAVYIGYKIWAVRNKELRDEFRFESNEKAKRKSNRDSHSRGRNA